MSKIEELKSRILVIGDALFESIVLSKTVSKNVDINYVEKIADRVGGSAFNFAKSYSSFGGQATLIFPLAIDQFSREIVKKLQEERITYFNPLPRIKATPRSIILSTVSKISRRIFLYPTDEDYEIKSLSSFMKRLDNISHVHLTCVPYTKKVLSLLNDRKISVSVDIQSDIDIFGYHRDYILLSSILFMSGRNKTDSKIKKTIREIMKINKRTIVVCTKGRKGVYLARSNNIAFYRNVNPVMFPFNTVGAGDAFAATCVFYYLRNGRISIKKCMKEAILPIKELNEFML